MNRDHALLVTAVLEMANNLAEDPDELNAILKTNRLVIDQLGQTKPDLWQRLKTHTQERRAKLQHKHMDNASPLTRRAIPRT